MAKEYTDITIAISLPDEEADGAYLNAEIESIDNDGETTYIPNIKYYLRLYKSGNITVVSDFSNFGSVGLTTSGLTASIPEDGEDDEYLIFNGSNSSNLNKAYRSNFAYTKIGRAYDKNGTEVNPTLAPTVGFTEVLANQEIYGVFQVTYTTSYDLYYFQSDRVGQMLIFFIGDYT
jgi:hypothetical protein